MYVKAEKQVAAEKKCQLVDLRGMFLAALKRNRLTRRPRLTRRRRSHAAPGGRHRGLGRASGLGVPDANFHGIGACGPPVHPAPKLTEEAPEGIPWRSDMADGGCRRATASTGRSAQWVDKMRTDRSRNLISLAYGKGKFVAAGGGGSDGGIFCLHRRRPSRETRKMTSRISPVLFEAGKFVAGGPGNQLLLSDNAETWSERRQVEPPKAMAELGLLVPRRHRRQRHLRLHRQRGPDQKRWWCITTQTARRSTASPPTFRG